MKKIYDIIIIGSGTAGLSCATFCKDKSVLFIEHNSDIGNKIRVSGGGRCNFANKFVSFKNYISNNTSFLKSVFSKVKPEDFIKLVEEDNICYAEKKLGQLFTIDGAEQIIQLFKKRTLHCDFLFNTSVDKIEKTDDGFLVNDFNCKNLIIATGGKSYPSLKASDFALKVAQQFDIKYYPFIPALCPLKTETDFSSLAGISLKVKAQFGKIEFFDDLLFTHNGISGPAVLQISSFLNNDNQDNIIINFLPSTNLEKMLFDMKKNKDKVFLNKFMKSLLPDRLVKFLNADVKILLNEISDKDIRFIANNFNRHLLKVSHFNPLNIGEVCKGGIDLNEIDNNFQSKKINGLFFVGEAVDVCGWLGGFNIFFAFSSGKIVGEFLNGKQ